MGAAGLQTSVTTVSDIPMTDETGAPIIFIAGPTASGKTAAALALARSLDAEIVNADAIQVYRDLEILSARPGLEALSQAPHHLFGTVDGAVRFSVGLWSRAAADVINAIVARGRAVIIVGGTGLYFRALEQGLSPIPDALEEARAAALARLSEIGETAFHREVMARDPGAAWIAPSDRQRLLRAWEIYESTGAPLSSFQQEGRSPLVRTPSARIVIEPDRAMLYQTCNHRFDDMLVQGALGEALRLMERQLDPTLPVMKALGAPELMRHLSGELSLEDAAALARMHTRRFAKRQLTWFRHQTNTWPRALDARAAIAAVLLQLGRASA